MFNISYYLAKNNYRSFTIILLSLISLFTIFSLIETIESKDSSIISILYFQILSTPGRLYDLIPLSILIGTTLSINLLSKNNEWIVLNVSGISNIKLILVLWLINIPIVIFSLFLSEYLVPIAEIKNLNNQVIKGKRNNNQFDSGYWISDFKNTKNIIINIKNIIHNGEIEKITLYEFDENKKLSKIYFADHGQLIRKCLVLQNVTVKNINVPIFENLTNNPQKKYINTSFSKNLSYETNIDREFLVTSKLSTDRISMFELYRYKKRNKISILQERELYNKISYLLLLFTMIPVAANSIELTKSKNKTRIVETLITGITLFVTIKLLPIIGSFYNFPLIITLITSIFILTLSIYKVMKRENI
ncbi:LptF/LptG family permease [Candidatus Kinetoplastidibacterium galati]|uniref:Lipopolysaccharide export system permease protein n=1 Tax=Candidatus Kinetoplastidibacterium galati TCC219 TaxID=1208921 RepID=M1MBY6_9PROT|nr:LptF/LptG family permease [Candidatus Kinetoplastibacterium galatii]AGF49320.1 lipopolysaccharide export system permease protein [Candidatus Kinetoplastibacterium galatii TCC219]